MTNQDHPGISAERYQHEQEGKYHLLGTIQLQREDGTIGTFAVASGKDALGNAKTLIYEPPSKP